VLVVVGHDDDGTREVAEAAAARFPDIVHVVVDHNWPKNKPKALNTALPVCRGDIVGVFDAEDEVAPNLLTRVDACFRDGDPDIVQGGVQLMNYDTSWYSLKNVLEYFFYFGSRLHLHARQRFIPLGGNTVFFRREVLDGAGGWDPDCLAEDCEIGVRLSCSGARTVVAYDPELSTREEAPTDMRTFIKQRTRWNQGFLQVLRKGAWRRLPTRSQRLRALGILGMPFFQAAAAIALPIQIISLIWLDVPIGIALFSWLPLLATSLTFAVELVGLHEFGKAYDLRIRWRDYFRLTIGWYAYYLLLAWSAVRAALREARGRTGWEKTSHSGVHRGAEPAPESAAA
jgi:cellulose synthase/poly-beta-1,6-N-acetylglucosamine synthase-like glycosyltransferase